MIIELYDASRLAIKRDHSLALALGLLLCTATVIGSYAGWLQFQLLQVQGSSKQLQGQLSALGLAGSTGSKYAAAGGAARASLLADLQHQAEQLETEAAADGQAAAEALETGAALTTSTPRQWLSHLGDLAQAELSLEKVEVRRSGSVQIEGVATSPQALSALVQTWDRHESLVLVRAQSIDIQQDKTQPQWLRFLFKAAPAAAAANGHKTVRAGLPLAADTAAASGAQP